MERLGGERIHWRTNNREAEKAARASAVGYEERGSNRQVKQKAGM